MRRNTTALLGLALAACGAVDQQPDAQGSSDAEASFDAPPVADAGAACDLSQPFDPPVPIPGVNSTASDFHGWLSGDGLTIYIDSGRTGGPGGMDIFFATRASTDDPFGAPEVLPTVNGDQNEWNPVVSHDGLTLFFDSNRNGPADIYQATRSSTSTAFGAPELVLNVNSTGDDAPTYIDRSGTKLYLSSTRSGDWELYVATRASPTSPFGAAVPIGELNIAGVEDYGAVLTGDLLTVYFESLRAPSLGCYDIYVATRSTVNDGFGTPQRVVELSTADCEWPTWVAADGCQIIFTSNRATTEGAGYNLWIASRPR